MKINVLIPFTPEFKDTTHTIHDVIHKTNHHLILPDTDSPYSSPEDLDDMFKKGSWHT